MSTPEPLFTSWEEYLELTTDAEIMAWCAAKAAFANRKRLMSATPDYRVTARDVYAILMAAEGRCCSCGSLAVEGRPSDPVTGKPLAPSS